MPAKVTVHIPGPLRGLVDQQSRLQLAGGTVGEVLHALVEQHPKLHGRLLDDEGRLNRFLNVFVNNEDIRFLSHLDTPVKEADGIMIVPAVAGG
ncbi:MAG TPA: ubiquitin-like small modifier protein 1 [Vicinamibacteria bacterium]|nr:ubiquitin-like small modifier protein 1 [Vicinamibacteria bacterium]